MLCHVFLQSARTYQPTLVHTDTTRAFTVAHQSLDTVHFHPQNRCHFIQRHEWITPGLIGWESRRTLTAIASFLRQRFNRDLLQNTAPFYHTEICPVKTVFIAYFSLGNGYATVEIDS